MRVWAAAHNVCMYVRPPPSLHSKFMQLATWEGIWLPATKLSAEIQTILCENKEGEGYRESEREEGSKEKGEWEKGKLEEMCDS